MNILILFLAVILACIVWWLLLQKLTTKPWVDTGEALVQQQTGVASYPPAAIGLGVFLAVITSLFALFTSAYFMRMMLPDWRSLTDPALLWLNTGLLALSSVAMQWVWFATDRKRIQSVRTGLLVGGLFAAAFLLGQLVVWRQLTLGGFFMASNPANTFFYSVTGLHGLHLLGGLVVWLRTTLKVYRTDSWPQYPEPDHLPLTIKLFVVYWHYLFILWLALFALLSLT